MTGTNSFINVHDVKLEYFYFLHKTFIVNIYSWLIKGAASLSAFFFMVVDIACVFGNSLSPGILHCLATPVQAFSAGIFFNPLTE